MKNRKYYLLVYISYLSTSLICLGNVSCQNDTEESVIPEHFIIGEWFGDYRDNERSAIQILELSDGGIYRGWSAYVSQENNFNQHFEGRYTYDGKIKTVYATKYSPKQVYQVWRVLKADEFMLKICDENDYSEQVFYRLVDTYNMIVGESSNINLNLHSFTPVNYYSFDTDIATVDDDGTIHAKKRGTTYIRVISEGAQVGVRIVVKDPENVMDDFLPYIGKPISNVIDYWGHNYLEAEEDAGLMSITYNIIDDILRRIRFDYYDKDHVFQIKGDFQDDVNISTILNSFDSKYEKIGEDESACLYSANLDNRKVYILIDEETKQIVYLHVRNGYELFDGFITLDINRFAKILERNFDSPVDFEYEISGQVIKRKADMLQLSDTENNIFEFAQVVWDEETEKLCDFILIAKENINPDEIKDWYENHYYFQNHPYLGAIYTSNSSYLRSEYHISIYEQDLGYIENMYLGTRTIVHYNSHRNAYL